MFNPAFRPTEKLIESIGEIERFYGRIEALRVPRKLELDLERKNLVQSSYVSNSIEGNPLTQQEVTNLLLGDRVPANRDEKEVQNYFNLLTDLDDYKGSRIRPETARRIHARLMEGVDDEIAGVIRNRRIVVGRYQERERGVDVEIKHEPPFHERGAIENALGELLDWLGEESGTSRIIQAGILHHEFVYIHPFVDGNGRVCRLLTALFLLRAGYRINKYFVLDDYYDIDRMRYSDKLNSADTGEKTEWLEYFCAGMSYSLQSALARLERGLEELEIEDRPTPREHDALEVVRERGEITSAELSDRLKVSRQQSHNLLSGLMDKGFLKKIGKTKGSYYRLA